MKLIYLGQLREIEEIPGRGKRYGLGAAKPSSHVTVQRYHFRPTLQHVEIVSPLLHHLPQLGKMRRPVVGAPVRIAHRMVRMSATYADLYRRSRFPSAAAYREERWPSGPVRRRADDGAIYLGSAPTATAAHRGIEDRRIKLGCVMPGETPQVFGDALRRLAGAATYLYQDGPRYWYSTQPTVTKLAEDRAEQLKRNPAPARFTRKANYDCSQP